MNSPLNEITFEDRLRDVFEKTDSREYADALDALELARFADPENIYISALRRQLDALLSLSQADGLGEDQRHDLMEPMPGIIDCAIRDAHRQRRTGTISLPPARPAWEGTDAAAAAHTTENTPEQSADPGDVQKELEALKLLYFQRASKFVMKGEYEQALAEVRRVFVVDPENTIAKEYASRVEHLIQHARALAAQPAPPADAVEENPQPIQAEMPEEPEPQQDGNPRVHAERSTAWDDEFVAPKTPAPLPRYRPTPPSSRQTVAYGDSLAVSLSASPDDEEAYEKPVKKKSKVFLLLATVILTPLLAGAAVAIFSTKNTVRNDVIAGAGQARAQEQSQNPAPSAVQATIGAPQSRTQEQPVTAREEPAHVAAAPTQKSETAPVELKENAEPPPVKTAGLTAPLQANAAASEPVTLPPPAAEIVPPPQPVVHPTEPPRSVTPAFVPVEKDPQIVKLEKPEFPSFVWKMGIEGQVVVRVLIDINGKPLDSQILKSTNSIFEQPVIDAVMKSQFTPARMGQGPVAAWLTIPFKFKQPN
jgi:protein TonB